MTSEVKRRIWMNQTPPNSLDCEISVRVGDVSQESKVYIKMPRHILLGC